MTDLNEVVVIITACASGSKNGLFNAYACSKVSDSLPIHRTMHVYPTVFIWKPVLHYTEQTTTIRRLFSWLCSEILTSLQARFEKCQRLVKLEQIYSHIRAHTNSKSGASSRSHTKNSLVRTKRESSGVVEWFLCCTHHFLGVPCIVAGLGHDAVDGCRSCIYLQMKHGKYTDKIYAFDAFWHIP